MKVDSLYIYPIKSMGGISVEKAELTDRGFKNDRAFMLVDEKGVFVSQRKFPKMALFTPSIKGEIITVKYKDDSFSFNGNEDDSMEIYTEIWNQKVKSNQVSSLANEWFSDQLGTTCRVVTYSSQEIRMKKFNKAPWSSAVSYADGYPYLIVGTQSLDDLNNKLDVKLGMDRFRPNIVVKTSIAFVEDLWEDVQIGQSSLKLIKRCSRCGMTTIDQNTGKRGSEPLVTLAGYRSFDKQICFGMNAIMTNEGIISVGDEVITRTIL